MIAAPGLDTVKDALNIEAGEQDHDARLNAIIPAVTALANKQAPGAPQAVGHEAIILAVGWLFESPLAVEQSYSGIWQRCGAKGLLSPWTVRHAGTIEAD